ncbi:hypothetical protein BB559_004761 [Furculomyces boomerangus]|uniref:Uncharacterized protein n=1 Tax=Furculomyces boomerangus TaxID=61424 RepID=A0A2T9YCV2_9FUNG|nr:hypothetical protein BB559_004761 [Furculomyces boomerangus]
MLTKIILSSLVVFLASAPIRISLEIPGPFNPIAEVPIPSNPIAEVPVPSNPIAELPVPSNPISELPIPTSTPIDTQKTSLLETSLTLDISTSGSSTSENESTQSSGSGSNTNNSSEIQSMIVEAMKDANLIPQVFPESFNPRVPVSVSLGKSDGNNTGLEMIDIGDMIFVYKTENGMPTDQKTDLFKLYLKSPPNIDFVSEPNSYYTTMLLATNRKMNTGDIQTHDLTLLSLTMNVPGSNTNLGNNIVPFYPMTPSDSSPTPDSRNKKLVENKDESKPKSLIIIAIVAKQLNGEINIENVKVPNRSNFNLMEYINIETHQSQDSYNVYKNKKDLELVGANFFYIVDKSIDDCKTTTPTIEHLPETTSTSCETTQSLPEAVHPTIEHLPETTSTSCETTQNHFEPISPAIGNHTGSDGAYSHSSDQDSDYTPVQSDENVPLPPVQPTFPSESQPKTKCECSEHLGKNNGETITVTEYITTMC